MQRIRGLLILLAGLAFGAGLGYVILNSAPSFSPARSAPPATGKRVEDFSLRATNGETMRLLELRGKPVLINFWATWCAPCREEMPLLNATANRLKDQITFLAINNDESPDVVAEYLQKLSIQFPVLLDPGGKINALYYVQSYPNTFFIDSEGILRAQHIGQLNDGLLARGLEAVEIKP